MTPLEEAPNIGPVLAGRLRAVGIDSLEALRRVGDAAAFARLYARYGVDACGHTRLALAGAVRGGSQGRAPPGAQAGARGGDEGLQVAPLPDPLPGGLPGERGP